VIDTKESGRWKSLYQSTIDKYGSNKAAEIRLDAARKGGKAVRRCHLIDDNIIHRWKVAISEVDMSRRGCISRLAFKMNCSHTHVRRMLNKYFHANVVGSNPTGEATLADALE
jgi:hypothetical protein